jgi:type II secretory pathway component GspD/PulD (secretin)
MRTRLIQSLVLICLFCSAGVGLTAFAADGSEPVFIGEGQQNAYEGIPAITFTVSKMELNNVIQFIGSLSKTKIEVDPSFSRSKVDCDFKGAAFAEVMANLARQVRGDVFWKDGKVKTFYFKPQPLNSASQKK